MCIELNSLRIESYGHTMRQVITLIGTPSPWDADLQRLPTVRALAFDGRLGILDCLLHSAKVQAGKVGFRAAGELLSRKQQEVAALRAEVAAYLTPVVDVVVLDDDWGRKGRGAKIIAWIGTTHATAAEVAERFQLAISTAKRYVSRAKPKNKSHRKARVAA